MPIPTPAVIAELQRRLSYNAETGELRYKVAVSGMEVGDRAGSYIDGYLYVSCYGVRYSAANIAWLLDEEEWPAVQVDHINRKRDDNRRDNLRLSTQTQQRYNTTMSARNTSGYRGVSWEKSKRKWRTDIRVPGKHVPLGRYRDVEQAAAVYEWAARHVHGEFYEAPAYINDLPAPPGKFFVSRGYANIVRR